MGKGREKAESPEEADLRKELGSALLLLRRRKGLTQTEASGRTKITKAMWSSYETSKTLPRLPSLISMLEGLELDLHDLQDALDLVAGRELRRPGVDLIPAQQREQIGGAVLALITELARAVANEMSTDASKRFDSPGIPG